MPENDSVSEVELRQMFELEDFGAGEAVERHRETMHEIGRGR